MLICRNAQGVHGQKKVGNPWFRLYTGTLCSFRLLLQTFKNAAL